MEHPSPFDVHKGKGVGGGEVHAGEKGKEIRAPPEVDVMEFARSSLTSLSSLGNSQLRRLSRLSSANHDVIKPTRKPVNPLRAAVLWWASWAIPGMGMFSEAYMIFAIGNIKPLLAITYPHCFGSKTPADCNKSAEGQVENTEICGIIGGMIIIGIIADWIGRKWGSRMTMSIMLIGGILLSSAAGPSAQTFLSVFMTGLFIYGFGVGGEYPLASASAAERAEGNPKMRKRRGETVVLTFSQQGWGNLVNTLVIVILLAMQGATSTNPTSKQASITWHVQFAIGTLIVLCVVLYRWFYLGESKVWAAERSGINRELVFEGERVHSPKPYVVIIKRYWSRLLITCLGWVVNDLAFYGNKLFINQFIAVISPNILAAFLVDKPWYGRRRMQTIGFFMMFVLFGACGVWYNHLIQPNLIGVFQFLYFFSSFWNQFGPNCTTWLVAGEVYPTDVRAAFHGISAACGKAGAIMASELFSHVDSRGTFYISALAGILGAVFTFIFLPDTTGLDLAEIDRHHRYLLAGQDKQYHGEAINPKYLSIYERLVGYGKLYNPADDRDQMLLQEMARSELYPVEEQEEQEEQEAGSTDASVQLSAVRP